jgi:hypothetical protein
MTLVLGNLGSTQVKASRNKTPALLQQSIKEKKQKQEPFSIHSLLCSGTYLTSAPLLGPSIRTSVQVDPAALLRTTRRTTPNSRLCSTTPSRTPRSLQARLRNSIRNRRKDLVDIVPSLGTRLKEQQPLLVRVILALLRADPTHLPIISLSLSLALTLLLHCLSSIFLLVLGKIKLIPHQRNHNPRARLPLQLGDPVLGLDQAAGFGDVVDDQRALRVAVVHGRQAGEALLPRRVPDFEFDRAGREGAFLG